MFRGLLIILAVAVPSFYFTDISSESVLRSVLLPIVDLLVVLAFAIWLVLFLRNSGLDRAGMSGGSGGVGEDWGGGDGGGGGE
jgi:uncharacterized membrane protein YgcG